jgi:hypothetical protein
MVDFFPKLKRIISEPKIYSVLVSSAKGQILYLGTHFSLEEAYAAARMKLEALSPHGPGDAIDIDLWNMISSTQVLLNVLDLKEMNGTKVELIDPNMRPAQEAVNIEGFDNLPSVIKELILNPPENYKPIEVEIEINEEEPKKLEHYVRDLRDSRNVLMKKLIENGDISKVEEFKTLLGSYAKRFVLKAIKDKKIDSNK